MDHPELPSEVVVLPGTDVEAAWERFHPFEALHHLHEICNPMRPEDLADVVANLDPGDGHRVIDVACGHGDLLLSVARRFAVSGVGTDLSPWVLLRATARAATADLRGTLEWWLGDGREVPRRADWDIATCLGASWIWHGFEGTLRALVARLRPGGRLAVGDLRLSDAADRNDLQTRGSPVAATASRKEQESDLTRLGLEAITEIVAPDEAWEQYHRTILESAEAYARDHPEADYRHQAAAWMEDFERDREYLTWSVWVARTSI